MLASLSRISRPRTIRPLAIAVYARYVTPSLALQLYRPFTTSQSIQSTSHSSSTVDQTEVSHFNALASTWWDPEGSSRLLHLMNPLRIDFVQSCLSRGRPTSAPNSTASCITYLDVGCGGGIFTESIARLASTHSVTGVDPSPEVYAIAVSHARKDPLLANKLNYLQTSIENIPHEKKYDIVTLFEVIEHVPYPSSFLRSAMSHVKPGGWLVLSTIARTWTSWATTIVAAEQVLGIVPRGTHDWDKYINEEEMRDFFRNEEGWGSALSMGVVYVPGFGWREVKGAEKVGNYFFAVRKDLEVN